MDSFVCEIIPPDLNFLYKLSTHLVRGREQAEQVTVASLWACLSVETVHVLCCCSLQHRREQHIWGGVLQVKDAGGPAPPRSLIQANWPPLWVILNNTIPLHFYLFNRMCKKDEQKKRQQTVPPIHNRCWHECNLYWLAIIFIISCRKWQVSVNLYFALRVLLLEILYSWPSPECLKQEDVTMASRCQLTG